MKTRSSRERQGGRRRQAAVDQTAELLLDVRASLHAYVAPGQGLPFWGKRAQETIDRSARASSTSTSMVTPPGGSLAESLDGVDQLAAAESRARTYVSRDEMQLAGDVIFTEVRDILAAATTQVQSVRDGPDPRARSPRRRDPAGTGRCSPAARVVVWIAIALLLFPTEPKPAVEGSRRSGAPS